MNSFSAALYKGGWARLLVHLQLTGINCVVSSHSLFMLCQDKKLRADFTWLHTVLRVILFTWQCQVSICVCCIYCHYVSVMIWLVVNWIAKMWGPGADQGGILQTSSCKLDLKEPYYRMSQPQAYPIAQDQPTHHLVNTQVFAPCDFFNCSELFSKHCL